MKEAEARGVTVEELMRERLGSSRDAAPTFDPAKVAEAVAKIRENRKRSTLGPDVTIKQLIEEGRRY